MDRSACLCARNQGPGAAIALKAVGFDFDHTLGIDNKLERVAFLRLLEPRAALIDEIERIDELLAHQRGGGCSIEDAVIQFVRDRGVSDPSGYPQRYKQMCVDMVESFVIGEPCVREMLAKLRERRIPYAILTNGWSPLQQRKAAAVGFDGPVLVSADLSAQKPSPQAFAALSRVLHAEPGDTAYIGDTPESDVAGSISAGLAGIWYDSERTAYPPGLPAPFGTVRALSEVAALIERL